jgi:hypothetical protein
LTPTITLAIAHPGIAPPSASGTRDSWGHSEILNTRLTTSLRTLLGTEERGKAMIAFLERPSLVSNRDLDLRLGDSESRRASQPFLQVSLLLTICFDFSALFIYNCFMLRSTTSHAP